MRTDEERRSHLRQLLSDKMDELHPEGVRRTFTFNTPPMRSEDYQAFAEQMNEFARQILGNGDV